LLAIGYEGSHVRTQTRVPVQVVLSNSPLSASFNTLQGGTNTAVESTLSFEVVANTNNISKIELFSTGGVVDTQTVNPAVLNVSAAFLGPGLHPFHALVTGTSGQRFRTATRWYRIIDAEPPITLEIEVEPTQLRWAATAGRQYAVWSAATAQGPYVQRDTVTPTNAVGFWAETNSQPTQYYRLVTN
jgi:hypothetical protein